MAPLAATLRSRMCHCVVLKQQLDCRVNGSIRDRLIIYRWYNFNSSAKRDEMAWTDHVQTLITKNDN